MNPIINIILAIIPQLSDKELETLNDKFLFEIWERQSLGVSQDQLDQDWSDHPYIDENSHECDASNYLENLRFTSDRKYK